MAPRKANAEIKGNEICGFGARKGRVRDVKAIFANTLVHVINLTNGRRTIARANGYWKITNFAGNSKHYRVTVLHIRIGGRLDFTCNTRCALKALIRSSLVITNIEDVSPIALGA